MYTHTFSTDLMKASSMEEDGYCKTVPTILISVDVLQSGELKRLKINRECDLVNSSINYMNHCDIHNCSCNCLLIPIIKVLYNRIKHKHIKDADIVTETSIHYAKL